MLEIERKFLVVPPNILTFPLREVERWQIEQIYLAHPGSRVRKIQIKEEHQYFYTRKNRISALTRRELEREISLECYLRLLKYADPKRVPLRKLRLRYKEEGLCWELDLFERFPNLALLEVELKDESQVFVAPKQFKIIKEVSDDPAYSSSSLALINRYLCP